MLDCCRNFDAGDARRGHAGMGRGNGEETAPNRNRRARFTQFSIPENLDRTTREWEGCEGGGGRKVDPTMRSWIACSLAWFASSANRGSRALGPGPRLEYRRGSCAQTAEGGVIRGMHHHHRFLPSLGQLSSARFQRRLIGRFHRLERWRHARLRRSLQRGFRRRKGLWPHRDLGGPATAATAVD